jgi:hypothetical protein
MIHKNIAGCKVPIKILLLFKEGVNGQAPVPRAYNPSYLGSRDWEFKASLGKKSMRPHLNQWLCASATCLSSSSMEKQKQEAHNPRPARI